MTSRTRVKICCIGSIEEARLAVAAGADALGLVGPMPSGPGVIDDRLIAEIARAVPPPVETVLLTAETDAEAIIDHARRTATGTIQLVDAVASGCHARLRRALPATRLLQVIHVTGERSIEEAASAAHHVHALLLDSGQPGAAVKLLGGTGRAHDWQLSRRIVEAVACPVFLAGGLNPANVTEAIATVRPFAVDICSGVRHEGRLAPERLAAFMAAVASAQGRLSPARTPASPRR